MNNPALAHSVSEACSIACAGRTSLYEAIRSGALRAVKRGRRTLILDDDLHRWVQSLPSVAVKPVKQSNDQKVQNHG
jgi:excisionase family DNA binding protein